MTFSELAWAGLCFYYRLAGDNRYSAVMSDRKFIERLRCAPEELTPKEFEEKAILGFINIQNYDLLIGHKLAENVLTKIIHLRDEVSMLRDLSLVESDLDDQIVVKGINRIYSELNVDGLWITGISKIAHLLNDRLLPPISLDIAQHFDIQCQTDVTPWLRRMQYDIQEATDDFHNQIFEGAPSQFLSDKLGYLMRGYEKSLIKFADEYYWLCYSDGLSIPPKWIPPID
jgi:hypothetical protein